MSTRAVWAFVPGAVTGAPLLALSIVLAMPGPRLG